MYTSNGEWTSGVSALSRTVADDCNWLGVASIGDDVPEYLHKEIEDKMDELFDKAYHDFLKFLDEKGLVKCMWAVITKERDSKIYPKGG